MRTRGLVMLVCVLKTISQAAGQIRGVNLGGWLTTEPWIAPTLYRNTTAADEWNLCVQLGKEACLAVLQGHWSSFYTKDDLDDIKQAGLNALRIPLGYWAVDLADYEPYVSGQYPYLIQAVQWAHELDFSVIISLHGVPGSQNGYAGSGLVGPILFSSNQSNTDRTLNVLKNLTLEFSQPTYGNTVTSIELMNEPGLFTGSFTMKQLQAFYTEGISTVQGADANMNISLSDAFYGPQYWSNWTATQANDHLLIDTHYFYAFKPNVELNQDEILEDICNNSILLKQKSSLSGIPPTLIGEWSLQSGMVSTGTQAWRTWLRLVFEAQIAAYTPTGPGQSIMGWMFWTWKTEHDVDTWSYRRGIAQGYIPANVSDPTQFVYPKLENGCVDSSYNYTAPLTVSTYVSPAYDNSSAGPNEGESTTSSSSESSSKSKSGASVVGRAGMVSWVLLSAAFGVAWWGL